MGGCKIYVRGHRASLNGNGTTWTNMSNEGSSPYTEVVVPHAPLAQHHCQEQDKAVARVHEKSGGGYRWGGVVDHESFDCTIDAPGEVSGVARELEAPAI